jgi:hypothetical protein
MSRLRLAGTASAPPESCFAAARSSVQLVRAKRGAKGLLLAGLTHMYSSPNAQCFAKEASLPSYLRLLVVTRKYVLLTLLMGAVEWLSALGLLLDFGGSKEAAWLFVGFSARALKLSIIQAVRKRVGVPQRYRH